MLVIILVLLGLCAGSFVNATVWRIHKQSKNPGKTSQKLSILRGRSVCSNCGHDLAAKDLIPILSWLMLRGKCRYCRKPIQDSPLVEFSLPVVFVLSYIWWPTDLNLAGQKLLLVTWLISAVGLMALLVYDYKWFLLPNRLIYPALAVAAIGRLGYILFYSDDIWHSLWLLSVSLLITSGLFWALFEVSKGKWIGFGDVRLGLITGCLLATPALSFLMIFMASVLGLLAFFVGAFGKNKSLSQKIPFGPFLITGTWLALLFGQSLINWYTNLLTVRM